MTKFKKRDIYKCPKVIWGMKTTHLLIFLTALIFAVIFFLDMCMEENRIEEGQLLEQQLQNQEKYMEDIANDESFVLPQDADMSKDEVEVKEEQEEPVSLDSGVLRESSAYTSTVGQTDSSPCISASGDNICELFEQGVKIVASNAFPLGTYVFVEGYGEAIVLDRMNSRYTNTVDVYFGTDTQMALNWGRKSVIVRVI